MSENCYIYWDDEEILDRKVYLQCESCFEQNKKGFLWQAKNGYADIDIICSCGKIIHKKDDNVH